MEIISGGHSEPFEYYKQKVHDFFTSYHLISDKNIDCNPLTFFIYNNTIYLYSISQSGKQITNSERHL